MTCHQSFKELQYTSRAFFREHRHASEHIARGGEEFYRICAYQLQSVRPKGGGGVPEHGEGARSIESKLVDLAALPEQCLSKEEIETIRQIGDNTGCMALTGASHRHPTDMEGRADEWSMRDDLLALAGRFGLQWTW